MKKFIYKTLLFSIPVVLFLIPPVMILKVSGENYTEIGSIIDKNDKYLIGYAYNENNYTHLKWLTINKRPKHKIMALGSSRVLQFRNGMFDESFYNAGYTVLTIDDYILFLQSIPKEKYPKYLILGLDQWIFNKNWNKKMGKKTISHWENSFSKFPKYNTYISVYKDLFNGKYLFNVYDNDTTKSKIGLNAIVNNKGFRNDGSLYYGKQIYKLINNDSLAHDFKFRDTYGRIDAGNERFEYGDDVDLLAIDKLDKLLAFCKKNNMNVIGFIPPFANSVHEKMEESSNYTYINKLSKNIIPIFKKHNFEFYNYPSVKDCNSTDEENIDGFHGGEVVYCNILIDMLKNNSILNNVTSIEKLEKDKKNRKNRYSVYE